MTAEIAVTRPSLDNVQTNRFEPDLELWQRERDKQDQQFNAHTAKVLSRHGFKRQSDRLSRCGQIFGYTACSECGQPGRMDKALCGLDRLCPTCARIRRRRLIEELLRDVGRINSRPVGGYRWRFGTLTIRTQGRYRQAVDKALTAFSQLWRQLLRGGRNNPVACFRALEFGPKNGNVHLHILYYGPYIDQGELSRAWNHLTGSPVVWIEEVQRNDLDQRITEVVKYITKFADVSNEQLVKYWRSTYKKRLIERYGLFRQDVLKNWIGPPPCPDGQEQKPSSDVCVYCGGSTWLYVNCSNWRRGPPPSGL